MLMAPFFFLRDEPLKEELGVRMKVRTICVFSIKGGQNRPKSPKLLFYPSLMFPMAFFLFY